MTALSELPGLLDRARQAGLWPRPSALFHDLDALRQRLAVLNESFPAGTLHAVAIKANPVIGLLAEVVEAGAGLEAASWEEVECALAAGCPPERLVYDSPVKTDQELVRSLRLGLWHNADSEFELERLAALGAPGSARVGLRVNPLVGEGSIAMTSTAGPDSKFGVPIDQAPAVLDRFPFVTGLHVHTGSQGGGLDLIEAGTRAVAQLARERGLSWLDVGGGVPIRYRDHDPEPPSLRDWGARLHGLGDLQLITEPGRAIHGPTGFALTRIESVKQVHGEATLFVHVGADLLLRRVYRPDQWDHEMRVLDPSGRPRPGAVPTRVAGPLCFAGDLLAVDRPLAPAQPGDLLWIGNTGAYTLAMWSRHCSRSLPPTIGFDADGVHLLHPGEQPADVVAFWGGAMRPSR